MLNTLKLLLPCLLPSWRFFDEIVPSPRIQFALLKGKNVEATEWHDFRPRPARLSFLQMLRRMLWNPRWNESLFLISCAERLMQQPTQHPRQHSEDEILKRIIKDLQDKSSNIQTNSATHLQFRLMFVYRIDAQLHHQVTFHSRIQAFIIENEA